MMIRWIYNRGLGTKFVIMVISILVITMSSISYMYIQNQHNLYYSNLEKKGTMLGDFVSLISPEAVLSYDFETLNDYMREVSEQEDVIYSNLVAPNGSYMTNYLDDKNELIALVLADTDKRNMPAIVKKLNRMKHVMAMEFPVIFEGEIIATLLLGISTKRIEGYIGSLLFTILFTITVLIVSLSLSIYVGFHAMAIRPITQLRNGLNRVAMGDLETKITVQTSDEIADLTHAFNNMVKELKFTINEKDNVQTQLQRQAEELLKLRDKALEASRAKSNFLANMSHELRTPLNAVIGYSDLLTEEMTDLGHKHYLTDLKNIRMAGSHLLDLISEILDLSKIEAGKMHIDLSSFSLNKLIDNTFSTIQPLAEKNKNVLQLDLAIETITMHSDIMKVRQLLLNLLSNACKFTKDGIITLKVMLHNESNTITFNIRDTGIGIATQKMQNLFLPFTQADATTTRKFGGTGLGLAISKKYCDMLNGEITVQSQIGKGTEFQVKLPINFTHLAARKTHVVSKV